jgi:site-specific recombinase XerD
MPTRDKKRGTWTGRVQKAGLPPKKKRGFTTKKAAKDWEIKTIDLMENPPKIHLTFSQCCSEFLLFSKRHNKIHTTNSKRKIIMGLLKSLGYDPEINQITNLDIETYTDKVYDESGGKCANRYLRELKTAFNWMATRGHIEKNPCNTVQKYKEEQFKKYVPEKSDIKLIFDTATEWERDFLFCTYYLAARRIELLRMTWDDIDFANNYITLWTRKRIGGALEGDKISMNKALKEILQKRMEQKVSELVFPDKNGNRMSKNTIDNLMPRLCKKAGVKRFSLHAIRHYAAHVMVASGQLSVVDIQKMLRHKRTTTTDTYLDQLADSKTRAAEILGKNLG